MREGSSTTDFRGRTRGLRAVRTDSVRSPRECVTRSLSLFGIVELADGLLVKEVREESLITLNQVLVPRKSRRCKNTSSPSSIQLPNKAHVAQFHWKPAIERIAFSIASSRRPLRRDKKSALLHLKHEYQVNERLDLSQEQHPRVGGIRYPTQ